MFNVEMSFPSTRIVPVVGLYTLRNRSIKPIAVLFPFPLAKPQARSIGVVEEQTRASFQPMI
jgi:hypothetical protein